MSAPYVTENGPEGGRERADRRRAELRIPGSVSNLGPGFDTLSVAVQVYLHVRVAGASGLTRPTRSRRRSPARRRAARTESRRRSATPAPASASPTPGVRIEVRSDIPTRGRARQQRRRDDRRPAALRTADGADRGRADLLALASEVEGHPDNAAAALLGGLTVSCQQDDGRVLARSWRWPADIQIVVATPDAGLETAHARRVLPTEITMRDAIFNLQRALLLVHALGSGQYGDLREALRDRWHQPARAAARAGPRRSARARRRRQSSARA